MDLVACRETHKANCFQHGASNNRLYDSIGQHIEIRVAKVGCAIKAANADSRTSTPEYLLQRTATQTYKLSKRAKSKPHIYYRTISVHKMVLEKDKGSTIAAAPRYDREEVLLPNSGIASNRQNLANKPNIYPFT